MFRILLPVALLALFYFSPLTTEVTDTSIGEQTFTVKAWSFIEPTFDCVLAGDYSFSGDCVNENKPMMSLAMSAAAVAAAVAAVFGVLGLVSFLSGIAGFFGVLGGLIGLAAVAWYGADSFMGDSEAVQFAWGFWAAGGVAMLMSIVGLMGMREE